MTSINLAVIDPNTLFRAGLVSLLSAMGFGSVEEVASVQELQRAADNRAVPDIVLIDLSRGIDDIDEAMHQVEAWAPGAKVVFLANELDVERLGTCFASGAFGYLLKDISRNALQESLRLVSVGEKVFPSRLASLMAGLASRLRDPGLNAARLRACNLSDREIEILRCLVSGQPNKVIAANLDIAESTVKVHLKSILRKTRAGNRTQAAIWALEQGLVNAVQIEGSLEDASDAGASDRTSNRTAEAFTRSGQMSAA
jgi:two-component system, NarL family, nitrate/nitrite response regulator NarL